MGVGVFLFALSSFLFLYTVHMRRYLFLFLALLLASCGTPEEYEDTFTFTEKDAEEISQILDRIENEQGIPEDGAEEEGSSSIGGLLPLEAEEVVIDVSDAHRFDNIRSELGALEENTYRVTNAFLNVRAQPIVQGDMVQELAAGDLLKVISFPTSRWAEVELIDGRKGFVSAQYIAQVVSDEQLEGIKKKYEGQYEVNFAFLNVRAEPNSGALKLGELKANALVKPISIDGEWAKVPFEGKEGFVSSQYLKPYLPKLLVRQDRFKVPVLRYRGDEQGTADALVQHLALLKAASRKTITLRDFYGLLLQQEGRDVRVPETQVILLISDVTADTIKDIADALHASDAQATFFVPSAAIGAEGISPQLIKLLVTNGNDVESAGVSGEDLRAMTNSQVLSELAKSRQVLEDLTGEDVIAVAYPRGGSNERVMEQAMQAGYLFGVTLTPSVNEGFSRSQFLSLPSNIVTASTTEQTLKSLVGVK